MMLSFTNDSLNAGTAPRFEGRTGHRTVTPWIEARYTPRCGALVSVDSVPRDRRESKKENATESADIKWSLRCHGKNDYDRPDS